MHSSERGWAGNPRWGVLSSTGRIITLNIKLSYVTHCSADDSHQQLLCNPLLTWQGTDMHAHTQAEIYKDIVVMLKQYMMTYNTP